MSSTTSSVTTRIEAPGLLLSLSIDIRNVMDTYSVRRAREDESEVLAHFMTLQAIETEGKNLVPETISQGVKGLFSRP